MPSLCGTQPKSHAKFYRGVAWDKLVITAVRINTFHSILIHSSKYWPAQRRRHFRCVAIVPCMTEDYFCHTMNISTRICVSGARPHRERGDTSHVDSKISMFILSIQLMECYSLNSIWSFEINILHVYICMSIYIM